MAIPLICMLGSLLTIILPRATTSGCMEVINLESDSTNFLHRSQGFQNCSIVDQFLPQLVGQPSAVHVVSMAANVSLCRSQGNTCEYCLQVKLKLKVKVEEKYPDDDDESADDSKDEGSAYIEKKELSNALSPQKPAILILCYTVAPSLTRCKRLECALNSKLTSSYQTESLEVVLKPEGLTSGSVVFVTVNSSMRNETINVPSTSKACPPGCPHIRGYQDPPEVTIDVDMQKKQFKISSTGNLKQKVEMCSKLELNGICKTVSRVLPLSSAVPCLCIMARWENGIMQSEKCVFENTTDNNLRKVLRENVLANVSKLNTHLSRATNGQVALIWNVNTPCQVDIGVTLCYIRSTGGCEESGKMENETWTNNNNGSWKKSGAFLDVNVDRPLCLMVKVIGQPLERICLNYARRWHWCVPVFGAFVLTLSLILICIYLRRTTLEKLFQKWQRTNPAQGFILLLHAPSEDKDPYMSELICLLGSTLQSLGFSVTLDLWSQNELSTMGPVPWLHHQMGLLRCRGGRALVVLSQAALMQAEDWDRLFLRGIDGRFAAGDGGRGCHERGGGLGAESHSSPISDVFRAAMNCLLEDHRRGCPQKSFSLVQFDCKRPPSLWEASSSMPLLFQGVNLHTLPSESRVFLNTLVGNGGPLTRCLSKLLMSRLQGTNETTRHYCSPLLGKYAENVPLQTQV